MAKKYDKEQLLADYKTGGYTHKELAYKYKISRQMVTKILKGVDKDLEAIVADKVEVIQELAKMSGKEVAAVDEIVAKEVDRLLKAEKIDDFLNSGLGIAAKKAVELIQDDESTMDDIAKFGKFQIDAKKGLGTLAESSKTVINNTNAQQNNGPITRVFHVVK